MRFIFKLISRLFAVMTLLFVLFYAYGLYLVKQTEVKRQALDSRIQSGNGFGGEAGMEIIDSDYSTSEFFWVDDDLLLFKIHRRTPENRTNRDNYIWDLAIDEVLPVDIDGSASCIREGYLYFFKVLNPNRSSSERGIVERFRSKLVRQGDRWAVTEKQNIKEVWPDIPDRHEYAWRDSHECKPKFYIPREVRRPSEVPHHYITYLSEWGWVYRRPRDGKNQSKNGASPSGFYEIGDAIHHGQEGQWRADSPEIPDLRDFSISYVDFIDKYWIANRLNLDFGKPRYLGLLSREGKLTSLAWSHDWPAYDAIPLPTRKGIFWDSRNPGTGINNSGGYLLAADNRVHKVIHGAAENLEVSPDGCKVAFYNRPKSTATGNSRLRIFNACNSSIQGREMTDVQYRDRTD